MVTLPTPDWKPVAYRSEITEGCFVYTVNDNERLFIVCPHREVELPMVEAIYTLIAAAPRMRDEMRSVVDTINRFLAEAANDLDVEVPYHHREWLAELAFRLSRHLAALQGPTRG